jgi:hypothetical protein
VLTARSGSSDPTTWTSPRAMYDVSVQGLADKPALKFFDRGTWQQWVELGPGVTPQVEVTRSAPE